MKYMMLIYETPESFARRRQPSDNEPIIGAWRLYYRAMVDAGIYVSGNPLQEPEMGTTVRIKSGKRSIQDGPYADTKEQLAGFIILELPSLDAAIDWASRCPAAAIGAVEVRPLAPEVHARITE